MRADIGVCDFLEQRCDVDGLIDQFDVNVFVIHP
jgi:hypothetical protein